MGGEPPSPLHVNIPFSPPLVVSEKLNMSNIGQFDGNDTIVSESEISSGNSTRRKPDRLTSALHMPIVATYNLRSIFPKLANLKKDILERNIQVAFCCEIWEKTASVSD